MLSQPVTFILSLEINQAPVCCFFFLKKEKEQNTCKHKEGGKLWTGLVRGPSKNSPPSAIGRLNYHRVGWYSNQYSYSYSYSYPGTSPSDTSMSGPWYEYVQYGTRSSISALRHLQRLYRTSLVLRESRSTGCTTQIAGIAHALMQSIDLCMLLTREASAQLRVAAALSSAHACSDLRIRITELHASHNSVSL